MNTYDYIPKAIEKYQRIADMTSKYTTWQEDLMSNLNRAAMKANSSTYALQIALPANLSREIERINGHGIAKALTSNVYKDINRVNGGIKAISMSSIMQGHLKNFENIHRTIAGSFDWFSKLNALPNYIFDSVQVELVRKYDDFIDTLDDSSESEEFIESVKQINDDLTQFVTKTLNNIQSEHWETDRQYTQLIAEVQGLRKEMKESRAEDCIEKKELQVLAYRSYYLTALGTLIALCAFIKSEIETSSEPQRVIIELKGEYKDSVEDAFIDTVKSLKEPV